MFDDVQKFLAAGFFALPLHLATVANAQQVVSEDVKILASDGAESDSFGQAIAIDDGVIVVGASWEGERADFAGAVYLFDTSGNQIIKLMADDGEEWDNFGIPVDIDNGIAAIGARGYSEDTLYAIGAVYLFDADPLSPNFGSQIGKLIADDASSATRFPTSLEMKDGIAVVGAPWARGTRANTGAAYLFDVDPISPNFGTQIAKVYADDGKSSDQFGVSVALGDGVLAVGADEDTLLSHNHHGYANDGGSVYLFDLTTMNQSAKILSDVPTDLEQFGNSLAIGDGVLAVGVSYADDKAIGLDVGAVLIFDLDTQQQLTKLTPFDGSPIGLFGVSVALENGVVAVGSLFGDTEIGSGIGAVYTYNVDPLSEDFGTLINKLISSDGSSYDFFGKSVDISNNIIVTGAHGNDDLDAGSGSAYIFNMNETCLVDFTNDGILNFADVSAFVNAFTQNDLAADFTNDGILNFTDVSAFVFAYSAGCP